MTSKNPSSVTPYHLLVFLGCWLGGIFDGMDSNLFSVMLPNAIQALTHATDKATISQVGSWVTFAFLIGWTLGGVLFGVIGDKLGRVKSMMFSILLYALFTGAAGFAQDPWQLAGCRFLTGLGIGGELVSIATMLSEAWPERSRAIAVGALITSYQVGVLLSGIITKVVPDWRTVFFIGALPALFAIVLRLQLKEPEKWQAEKAKQLENQEHVSPLKTIFKPPHRSNVIVGGLAFGGLLIGYWASLAWIPTWIQDLLGAQALGSEKSIATIYHGVAAIVGCMISGWLVNTLGRRWTMGIAFLGAFISSAILFLTNPTFTEVIYWQDAALGFFIGLSQSALYIYLPELFTTQVRATAVGFCMNVGRLSAAMAVLFVGTLVALLGGYGQAALTFAGGYLIGFISILMGQETQGQALPD